MQPDTQEESARIAARIHRALGELPAEQRDVFLLREEGGMSLAEIADVCGIGVEAAKSRLRYALAKLKATLEDLT
jgi:RNA polymerase sigma-70 factor (ECF subfamily)